MPSPFPGMNPYLERPSVFHDFHERFLPACSDAVAAQILPRYFCKIDEHVSLHERSAEERQFVGRADLTVAPALPTPSRPPSAESTSVSTATAAAAARRPAPVQVRLPSPAVDVQSESFLEIRDRQDRRLITVVELLSRSNKAVGPDRESYLDKRKRRLRSGVHLVEIDLLRVGQRMPAMELPSCDYGVLVSRAEERPNAGFWPIRLREPLPTIPIPLKPEDSEATLDLAALVHRLYDATGYAYYVDGEPPDPALSEADQAWADALRRSAPR